MTELQSPMALHGARLVDNGYPVIPIAPGTKRPGRYHAEGWRGYMDWARHCARATTPIEVDIWRRWPGCAIGIATGAIVAIDIDVMDADIALCLEASARAALGDTPATRIGQAPKRMLIYRAEQPFPGKKWHPLEILGTGQQFVAYAIHPGTGRPYEWPDESLAELDAERLPVVTETQCLQWLEQAWNDLPAELRVARLPSEPHLAGHSDARGTTEAVRAALLHIHNPDLGWEDWSRIGMAAHAATGGTTEGLDAWSEWSARSAKHVDANCAERWQHWFRSPPSRLGAGTLYWHAQQAGWVPEPGLILNANVAAVLAADQEAAAVAEEEPIPEPSKRVLPIPAEVYQVRGALKLFLDECNATAFRPQPFFALAAAISLVGALAGRRYRTKTDLRSNIYVVQIGDSGAGKNHALRCIQLTTTAANLLHYLGGGEIGSGGGVLGSLCVHPARLFCLDEFGKSLASMQSKSDPHRRAIMEQLLKLYSSAGSIALGTEYADQKSRPRTDIFNPHACVLGATTPGEFWRAMEYHTLGDGFTGRMLVFVTDNNYTPKNYDVPIFEPSAALVAQCQAIAAGVPDHDYGGNLAERMMHDAPMTPYTVPMSRGAAALHIAEDIAIDSVAEMCEGMPSATIYARVAENAAKLALISAVGRAPSAPLIDETDMAWAWVLAKHCAQTMDAETQRHVARNVQEANTQKVLDIIARAGRINKSMLSRKTQFLKPRERDDIIGALQESMQIVQISKPTGRPGRPTVTYQMATGHDAVEEIKTKISKGRKK